MTIKDLVLDKIIDPGETVTIVYYNEDEGFWSTDIVEERLINYISGLDLEKSRLISKIWNYNVTKISARPGNYGHNLVIHCIG